MSVPVYERITVRGLPHPAQRTPNLEAVLDFDSHEAILTDSESVIGFGERPREYRIPLHPSPPDAALVRLIEDIDATFAFQEPVVEIVKIAPPSVRALILQSLINSLRT